MQQGVFLYLGELVAMGTTLSWSIGIFPFTEASRRLGPNSVNHFRLVLAIIFLSILSFLLLDYSFFDLFRLPLPQHWLWFGISGVIGLALGDYFGFTSFAILGARVGSIFIPLAPAAALFAGYFMVGERINLIGIIGIFITIGGVLWLTMSKTEKSKIPSSEHGKIEKGILFGILASVCQGVGVVLANKGFETKLNDAAVPAIHATWIRMVMATAVIYVITISRGRLKLILKPVFENKNKGIIYTFAGTFFGPVMGVSLSMYAISLLENKPSVAQTIFSLVPVLVLPFNYLFYKEPIKLQSVLGALVAIGGVLVLIWRNEIQNWF
jgi:drug/metabolite transporter (DMT)-like permease